MREATNFSLLPSISREFCTLSSFDNENERRIPVDPVSLTEIGMFEEDGPLSMPEMFTEVTVQSPILPPLRTPRFVSASLPCSANSSPHYTFLSNQKWVEEPNLHPNSVQSPRTLARQHSLALRRFASNRSMSFAEGRTLAHNDTFQVLGVMMRNSIDRSPGSSSSTSSESPKTKSKSKSAKEDDFKCGALCMNLPSFSKKKQMQLRHQANVHANGGISRLASLEKFDCGSWSPHKGNACDPDTPVEMERSSQHDTDSPIHSAFLFDGVERRGILKKSSSRFNSSKSMGLSNRHVRFSVVNSPTASCPSSPSVSSVCISPRLRRAREEFTAFLEAAQSA
ncbi:uncharacterized protein LOC144545018 [Carex rostrata]